MAKTVGPFSPWCRIGQTIATSGQIGLGEDGKVVDGGFGPELEQTLRNLSNVLADAGVTREQVIKVNVYLADLADWSTSMAPTLSSLALRSQHGPPSRRPRSRSVPGSRSRPGPSSRRLDERGPNQIDC